MWDKRNIAMRAKKFMSEPYDWSVESQILLWSNNEPLAIAQERNESLKTSQKSEAVQMRSQAKCWWHSTVKQIQMKHRREDNSQSLKHKTWEKSIWVPDPEQTAREV